MIATTIEQSERLLACGIKAETADMSYRHILEYNDRGQYWETRKLTAEPFEITSDSKETISPAWSLSALLTKVLPPIVDVCVEAEVQIGKADDEWYCEYLYTTFYVSAKDPIEACVRMVELLHGKDVLL